MSARPVPPPPRSACRLYLISPALVSDPWAFAATVETALEGGDVAALQIRLKGAADDRIEAVVRAVAPIARRRDVALILNDRPDLAARLGCDGVHIGQQDMPLRQARGLMGAEAVIGVTCHDSRHLAMEAAEGGADYVAFGAFFPTTTKETTARPDPEILTIWQETMLIPCVAIGGVTVENCAVLAQAGADMLAVSAGVWAHPHGPAAAVAAFNAVIGSVRA